MADTKKKSVFETLASIDISQDIVKKEVKTKTGKDFTIDYVPWARAIEKLRMHYPDAIIEECTFTTKKFVSVLSSKTKDGETYETQLVDVEMPYGSDGKTCWVKTCIKIPSENIEEYCTLPIMDNSNNAVAEQNVTSTHVNKALRRCVAKNIAYLGYGLSMWLKDDYTDLAKDKKVLDGLDRQDAISKFKAKIKDGFDRDKLAVWLQTNFGVKNPMNLSDELLERLNVELDKLDINDFKAEKKAK